MKATVLSIKQKNPDTFELDMCLGKEQYKFRFTVERDVREQRLCAIVEDNKGLHNHGMMGRFAKV